MPPVLFPRMALDQIPNTGKELRFRIIRNIGNAFIKMGQFQDAIESYETVMTGSPDIQTALNLLLCYFARGTFPSDLHMKFPCLK